MDDLTRAIAEELAGGPIDEDDVRKADDALDEWCAECIGRLPAAVNAARIAVEVMRRSVPAWAEPPLT